MFMIFKRWIGVPFVNRAYTESGDEVKLRVTPMMLSHVLWWHSHVQPVIDNDPDRVDKDWNWLLYFPFAAVVGTTLRRKPAGYVIGIVTEEEKHLIPCAMVILLGRFPALDNHKKKSAFTWYLTTAPSEALVNVKEYDLTEDMLPKQLGSIALDVVITHSVNHRCKGRMALYADKKGGPALLEWYEKKGLQVLPLNQRLPRSPRRLFKPNDGRYCFLTPRPAMIASRRLDHLRK
jgi:hypothetical protein